jgi:hypothetical protein
MRPKEPCPHCGRLYTVRIVWVPGVEEDTAIKTHEVDDHACVAFRTEPPLLPFDPTFRVIPDRSEDDIAYAMHRYRRGVRWHLIPTATTTGSQPHSKDE